MGGGRLRLPVEPGMAVPFVPCIAAACGSAAHEFSSTSARRHAPTNTQATGFEYDPCTDTGESGALVRKRLTDPSRLRAAGLAVLLAGFLFGGWGLAGVVASGSTDATPQLYRVTITKTIKIRGKNGKVVTHVVHSIRIVKRPVAHNVTNVETLTTPGGTRVVTTQTTKVVPVIRVRNKVVTVNGKPVTIAQTVTDMQTQTQSVTQTQTQAVADADDLEQQHAVRHRHEHPDIATQHRHGDQPGSDRDRDRHGHDDGRDHSADTFNDDLVANRRSL